MVKLSDEGPEEIMVSFLLVEHPVEELKLKVRIVEPDRLSSSGSPRVTAGSCLIERDQRPVLTDTEKEIYSFIREHDGVVASQIAEAIGCSHEHVRRLLSPGGKLRSYFGVKNVRGRGYFVEQSDAL